jgi:hypothetical protein
VFAAPHLGMGPCDSCGGQVGEFFFGGFGDAGQCHFLPDSGQQCFVRFLPGFLLRHTQIVASMREERMFNWAQKGAISGPFAPGGSGFSLAVDFMGSKAYRKIGSAGQTAKRALITAESIPGTTASS